MIINNIEITEEGLNIYRWTQIIIVSSIMRSRMSKTTNRWRFKCHSNNNSNSQIDPIWEYWEMITGSKCWTSLNWSRSSDRIRISHTVSRRTSSFRFNLCIRNRKWHWLLLSNIRRLRISIFCRFLQIGATLNSISKHRDQALKIERIVKKCSSVYAVDSWLLRKIFLWELILNS